MQVLTSDFRISELKTARFPVNELPNTWRDASLNCSSGNDCTVSREIPITGHSTFGGKPVTVTLKPRTCEAIQFWRDGECHTATIEEASSDVRSIQLGRRVRIVEHLVSVKPGLGLKFDVTLSADCLPAFGSCMEQVVDLVKDNLTSTGPSTFYSVPRPVAFHFANGAYIIFEPDGGEQKLVVDHQFSHSGNLMGNQRVQITIDPQVYAFVAKARVMSYGIISKFGWPLSGIFRNGRVPFMGVSRDNVVFVSRDEIHNPRGEFTQAGVYFEPILHEVIDKLGAIALIPGRFVGTVRTFRTRHKQDLEAIRALTQRGDLSYVG